MWPCTYKVRTGGLEPPRHVAPGAVEASRGRLRSVQRFDRIAHRYDPDDTWVPLLYIHRMLFAVAEGDCRNQSNGRRDVLPPRQLGSSTKKLPSTWSVRYAVSPPELSNSDRYHLPLSSRHRLRAPTLPPPGRPPATGAPRSHSIPSKGAGSTDACPRLVPALTGSAERVDSSGPTISPRRTCRGLHASDASTTCSPGGLVYGGPLSRPLSYGVCALTGSGRRGCRDGPRRRVLARFARRRPPSAGARDGLGRSGSGRSRRSRSSP